MKGDDGGDELARLDLALVSAAILLSKKYHVETALASPAEVLDIEQVCQIIAELGSPPVGVNVARDLATAGYGVADLKPLLRSTMPPGSDESDEGLEHQRAELARLGSTVSWPGFPPGRPPERADQGPPDEPTRDPS